VRKSPGEGLRGAFWWGLENSTFSEVGIYYVCAEKAFRVIESYLEKGTFSEIKNVVAAPFIGEK
jgi:hypothetical protein